MLLAKKSVEYVRWRNDLEFAFSTTAQSKMKLYNFAMKTNRNELLIRTLELGVHEMADLSSELVGDYLRDSTMIELRRQASLLGLGVQDPAVLRQIATIITKSSFHGQTFSERIWNNQETLMKHLREGIAKTMIQGKHPTSWMREMSGFINDEVKNANYAMKRLAVTESGRVQIEAQRESYDQAGIDQYMIITEPGACPVCLPFDGKVFPVTDMVQGVNAPMFHPNCKCTTAAYEEKPMWMTG